MLKIAVQQKSVWKALSYRLCYAPRNYSCFSIENDPDVLPRLLSGMCLLLQAVMKLHRQIHALLCSSSSVPLGFDLLLSPTSVFILVSFCNLPSFPNMGPWQHTRGLLHLLPKLPSSSPIVIHMYDVQSPRSFYYRGWHLTTLFLDSDQFLMSLTLILLSIDYKLTESAGHSKEVRGWRSGRFYSPSR